MPRSGRRVIYIQNPRDGRGHFRTIHAAASRPPKVKAPKDAMHPYGLPGVFIGTGGAHYGSYNSSWAIGNHLNPAKLEGLYQPGLVAGQYEQTFTPAFQPASTFLGAMYDIFISGIDPDTGQDIPPYGTPGTLLPSTGTIFGDLRQESMDAGRIKYDADLFGASPTNPHPRIPSGYSGRATNYHRPGWLEWYEGVNQ